MIELDPNTLCSPEVTKALKQTQVTVKDLLIDFSRVPHKDPQSYVHGFYRGWCGDDILANGRSAKAGFSDTYLEGYRHGRDVLEGRAQLPEWASTP